MFARTKKSGRHEYLQIVHNERVNGKIRQHTIGTVGRLDRLRESGDLARLLSSLSRYEEHTAVLTAHRNGELPEARSRKIGPGRIFGRLWEEVGIQAALSLARGSALRLRVERAIFQTVVHRLLCPGSDRAAQQWRQEYHLPGTQSLGLHHLYRAMAWLGEELPAGEQAGDAVCAALTRRISSKSALRPTARSVLLVGSGLLRHDLDLLRGGGGRDAGAARQEQGLAAGPQADGRGGGSGRRGASDVLRAVAGQHHRRQDPGPHRGPAAETLRHRRDVRGGRSGDDQREDDRRAREASGGVYILGARMRRVRRGARRGALAAGRYQVVQGPRTRTRTPRP